MKMARFVAELKRFVNHVRIQSKAKQKKYQEESYVNPHTDFQIHIFRATVHYLLHIQPALNESFTKVKEKYSRGREEEVKK